MRKTSLLISAATLLAGVSVSHATLFAYEGFDAPKLAAVPSVDAPAGTQLDAVTTTGTGFSAWVKSNSSAAATTYLSTGLTYPASYTGSFIPVGGSGKNGNGIDQSMYRLNLSDSAAVNNGGTIYVSFLGLRVGAVTPDTGMDGLAAPGTFTNPYPRNAGARFPDNDIANNNGSLGLIGTNGNTAATYGWGVWGWKDQNGLIPDPQVAMDDAGGVPDFVVVALHPSSSGVEVYFNPMADGSTEEYMYFINTDGGLRNLYLGGFGVEAGSASGNRAGGEWIFDEIRIGSTFQDVTGYAVPEPSTYAAVLGLLAMGFVWMRRRRK